MEPSTSDRISTLKVTSDLSSIPTVLEWFEQFRHHPMPEALWIQGQTALVEGFTNAVRHAHAHLAPPPDVETSMEVSAQGICLEIRDQGQVFDLELALRDLSQQLQQQSFDPLDREEHWGHLLLLKLRNDHGWQISYHRQPDDRNCLQISHALTGATSVSS